MPWAGPRRLQLVAERARWARVEPDPVRAPRGSTDRSSVKALTVYDVVASTSCQTALFVGGFVVAAAETRSTWPVDPYRMFLLLAAGFVLHAVRRLRIRSGSTEGASTQ